MRTFLNFHVFAQPRGEGLHPQLRLLFERGATAPFSDDACRHDGGWQSGPDPVAEIVPERMSVSFFPQASAERAAEPKQRPEMSVLSLGKHTT
jgi:hypothetical protein